MLDLFAGVTWTCERSRWNRPSQRLTLAVMLLFLPGTSADQVRTHGGGVPVVRVVVLVPADKPVRADYAVRIESAIKHLQVWYRNELSDGRTFTLRKSAVEVVQTPHAAEWYSTTPNGDFGGWFFNNVLGDAFAATGGHFDDPNNIWVFYIDADPACRQLVGATNGVAVLPANDLRGLRGEANIPPCPTEPPDAGRICRWVGGLGHELGHAFGLPHPTACEDNDPTTPCPDDALLWLGYRTYPTTFLLQSDRDVLNQSPFFSWVDLPTSLPDCSGGDLVPVDVQPRRCPNRLNVRPGLLRVAIPGTDALPVTRIAPGSIRIANTAPVWWSINDVATPFSPSGDSSSCTQEGPDGHRDLVLRFDRHAIAQGLGLPENGEVLVLALRGRLKPRFGATSIIGGDVVVVRNTAVPANEAPIAGFTMTADGVIPKMNGETLTVTAPEGGRAVVAVAAPDCSPGPGIGCSYDRGGHIARRSWTLDGNPINVLGDTLLTELTPGTHTVTLVVTDDRGAESQQAQGTIVVSVVNQTPIARDDSYTLTQGTTLSVPAPGVCRTTRFLRT